MDNLRLMLWLGLGLALWMGYQAWRLDYPPAAPVQTTQPADVAPPIDEQLPELGPVEEAPLPAVADEALPSLPGVPESDAPAPELAANRIVQVTTDVLDAQIGLDGGNLIGIKLLNYPVAKNQPDVPVTLLNSDPAARFELQSGLRTRAG